MKNWKMKSFNVKRTSTKHKRSLKVQHGRSNTSSEDLFAEMCMRRNEVTGTEVFDISKDGCCEAKRPGNVKKNKKWKPDCASTSTPAIHPFKKPEEYKECMEKAENV